jgi:hypothetical protein
MTPRQTFAATYTAFRIINTSLKYNEEAYIDSNMPVATRLELEGPTHVSNVAPPWRCLKL